MTKSPAETKLVISARLRFTLWRVPEELPGRVRARWPGMNVVYLPHHDLLAPELPDMDIFVGYLLRREQLRLATRLVWLHSISAGVSQLMYPELRESNIVVTNASGVHAAPMAEHVAGFVIALARDFPGAMRYQLRRQWAQQEIWDGPARPREIANLLALVVGFGAVGQAIAERLRALGMRVWAVSRSGHMDPAITRPAFAGRVFPAAQLDAALPEADFVVLEHRSIAGAALDVAAEEPLPAASPLWTCENVFITPHVSGTSERVWERESDLLLDNLERWFSGQELRNRVDLKRGY